MIFDLCCIGFLLSVGLGAVLTLLYGPELLGRRWPARVTPYDWAEDAPEFGFPKEAHVRSIARHQSSHIHSRGIWL